MSDSLKNFYSLKGQLLIAMPQLEDSLFANTVIYLCGHDPEGAMGIVVNKPTPHPSFRELLEQLNFPMPTSPLQTRLYLGGPIEIERGFVLHSTDYTDPATIPLTETISLTATVDILKAIAAGKGPTHHLISLGYSGWEAGQLEKEILENSWINVAADLHVLFEVRPQEKWQKSLEKIGLSSAMLSLDKGHA